jgi:hypothetical protein
VCHSHCHSHFVFKEVRNGSTGTYWLGSYGPFQSELGENEYFRAYEERPERWLPIGLVIFHEAPIHGIINSWEEKSND